MELISIGKTEYLLVLTHSTFIGNRVVFHLQLVTQIIAMLEPSEIILKFIQLKAEYS